jgi:hypothetical protein
LAVKERAPLDDVTAPSVNNDADAPVVVIEKLPPTVEVFICTAPECVMSAVPVPPVFAEISAKSPAVCIGVPDEPMLPVPEVRLMN